MKKALRTIVYATISPSEYFATRVKEAIKGFGTDDSLLMRVLITRDEIDMNNIKQYYKQLYKKDMVEDIKSDIGGEYKKLMVELCSH
jgi:annexin A7/11